MYEAWHRYSHCSNRCRVPVCCVSFVSSSQNYTHPDNPTIRTTDTPGFKPFTTLLLIYVLPGCKKLLRHLPCTYLEATVPTVKVILPYKVKQVGAILNYEIV